MRQLFAWPTYAVTASAFIRLSATARGHRLRSWHLHAFYLIFFASIAAILPLWLVSAGTQRPEVLSLTEQYTRSVPRTR